MPLGPGKYDALATDARVAANADAVILVVLGGDLGSGFCVQTRVPLTPAVLAALLRKVADDIDAEERRR